MWKNRVLQWVAIVVALFGIASGFEFTDTLHVLLGDGNLINVSYVLQGDEVIIRLETFIDPAIGGWVGFGIGENRTGSMKGSDIVTSYIDFRGELAVEDRHLGWVTFPMSPSNTYPDLDKQQDWVGIEGSETDGVLSVTLKRKLDTGDSEEDRVIDPVFENRVIVAKGEGRGVGYHSAKRGTGAINFSRTVPKESITLPDDVNGYLEIKHHNYSGFAGQTTTYACSPHVFDFDKPRDIVAFEPILEQKNLKYLHHMLLVYCSEPFEVITNVTYDTCEEMFAATGGTCNSVVFAWAVGGGPLVFPDNVALRVGNQAGLISQVMFQFHYDNPNHDVDVEDSSGVRLYYTETPREHEAFVLSLGDPFVSFSALAPLDQCQTRRGMCNSDCTNQFSHPIHTFSNLMHTHSRGRQSFTKLNGEIVSRVDYWDFGFQHFKPINYTINPGDTLETVCNYDTAQDRGEVVFGDGSLDEMCMDYVYYYPRDNMAMNCGILLVNDTDFPFNSICGDLGFISTKQNETGPGQIEIADFLSSSAVCVAHDVATPGSPAPRSEVGLIAILVGVVIALAL